MNYHKLLTRQISRHLPEALHTDETFIPFLKAISESYTALERDKESAERAFRISEEEYINVNEQLKAEAAVKKLSVEKLKEAIGTITGETISGESDDLLMITRYLKLQVSKRRDAEKFFTSLISNLQSGILLEDERSKVVFANKAFFELFNIQPVSETGPAADYSILAESYKTAFKDPGSFIQGIETLLDEKKLVTGEILELTDGKVYERDYIPVFSENKYKGHLWSYTDITEKKKNEDAIKESELTNRLIMNSALDAIITIDKQGRIIFWNPQAEKIFGWQEHEAVGQKLSELIIPHQFREAHEKGLEHYNRTGEDQVLNKLIELQALNRNGKEFPVELSIVPVRQASAVFFCSFIRDISERKKQKAELERLSLVASSNENGVVFTTPEGIITWVNSGFSKLTGFTKEEAIGKTPVELCRGALTDADTLRNVVDSFIKGEAFNAEIIYYRKDKSWFLGRSISQPVKNEKGTVVEYFGIIEDITSANEINQKIKRYEEQLKVALTNLGDNYWEHNFKTGKTFFSNPINSILGFSLDEQTEIAKLWWEQVHPEDKCMLEENSKKYQAGEIEQHNLEYRMMHKNGPVHWVLDRGVVIEKDATGKPLKIIGTHLDITRQKNLEADLTRAKEAAEATTRTKELFLANMSHEIRTPMNAILGMGSQLSKTDLSGQQKFFLQAINTAAENLLVIINDILDLSKIEAGKLSVEKIGFEPRKIIANAMQVLMHKAEEKGLRLTNSVCDKRLSPVLIGDPFRLNQVLLNLMSNAVKFTEKGCVDITCGVIEETETSQTVEMKVVDTGIGMDQGFVEKLFDKFSQEYESVTRKYGGTGLGMSICKELVGLMGGGIDVISEKGKGTAMCIRIEFKKGTAADLPAYVTEQITGNFLQGKTILVTDDNDMNRLVASTILEEHGATIVEATNGEEALQMLANEKIDLVLMDIQMPILNGYDATKIIRRHGNTVPVIALTANAIKGENKKCIDAGMNDYVTKPFKEDLLLNTIAHWLKTEFPEKGATVYNSLPDEKCLYDLSSLDAISRGNTAFVAKMIKLFCDQAPEMVRQIQEAWQANNLELMGSLAHKMKPSIDNLNIISLKQPIRTIERAGKEQVYMSELQSLIQLTEQTIKTVITQLNREFAA